MRWTERQRSRCWREMGIRLWSPAAGSPRGGDRSPAGPPPRREGAASRLSTGPCASSDAPPPPCRRRPASRTRRAAIVDAMDWPALRAAVAACTACSLCEGRTQTVFGVGNEQAHWMIVGEAPGEQEDLQGEPFVGKAGQLLDNMLRAIGLTREPSAAPSAQVFIANTLKCRPPRNRNPEPDELAQCEPFLQRQVALVQPRIILAMGRFAVQSLLRSAEPIGPAARARASLPGRAAGRHVPPGLPAAQSRKTRRKAWDDLCLAREVARSGPSADADVQRGHRWRRRRALSCAAVRAPGDDRSPHRWPPARPLPRTTPRGTRLPRIVLRARCRRQRAAAPTRRFTAFTALDRARGARPRLADALAAASRAGCCTSWRRRRDFTLAAAACCDADGSSAWVELSGRAGSTRHATLRAA